MFPVRLMRKLERGVIALVVLSVAFGCYGISKIAQEYDPNKQQHQNTKDLYCDPAARPPELQPGAVGNRSISDPTPGARYYELCQQWRAAEATEQSANATKAQAVIAFVALLGLWLTVRYAKQAAIYTKQSASAGQRSADEARRSADAARMSADAFVAAEGARVFAQPKVDEFVATLRRDWEMISNFQKVMPTIAFGQVPIEFVNYGKPPATLRDIGWGMVLGPLPAEPAYTKLVWPELTVLPTGVPTSTKFTPIPITLSDFTRIRGGDLTLHHFGRVLYADIFNDAHELRVLYRFDAKSQSFWRVHEPSAYVQNT